MMMLKNIDLMFLGNQKKASTSLASSLWFTNNVIMIMMMMFCSFTSVVHGSPLPMEMKPLVKRIIDGDRVGLNLLSTFCEHN